MRQAVLDLPSLRQRTALLQRGLSPPQPIVNSGDLLTGAISKVSKDGLDHRDRQRLYRQRRIRVRLTVTDETSLRATLCLRMPLEVAPFYTHRAFRVGVAMVLRLAPLHRLWPIRGRFVDPYR